MLRLVLGSALLVPSTAALAARPAMGSRAAVNVRGGAVAMSSAYDFSAKKLGSTTSDSLSEYEGKVSLIVNVASK